MSDFSTLPTESKSKFHSFKYEFLVTEAWKIIVLRSGMHQIKFWFLHVKDYENQVFLKKNTTNKEKNLFSLKFMKNFIKALIT